jgi:uncharacterized membrane protein YcaP (DUF421 family)
MHLQLEKPAQTWKRKLRLWPHQWIGVPALLAIPIAALLGPKDAVLRVAAVYAFVLVSIRLVGKRQLAQLSPFDLVTLMLIPDIAQQGMDAGNHSLREALIGLATLFSLTFFNGLLTYLSDRANTVVEGKPRILFHDGNFAPDIMDRERIHPSEILGELRKFGYENLDQIKYVIAEPEGALTFIPRDEQRGSHTPSLKKAGSL